MQSVIAADINPIRDQRRALTGPCAAPELFQIALDVTAASDLGRHQPDSRQAQGFNGAIRRAELMQIALVVIAVIPRGRHQSGP